MSVENHIYRQRLTLSNEELVIGLDIGMNKVCDVIRKIGGNNLIEIAEKDYQCAGLFGGVPYSISTIPVGGTQITSDISIIKSISQETAKKQNWKRGAARSRFLRRMMKLLFPGLGKGTQGHTKVADPRDNPPKDGRDF